MRYLVDYTDHDPFFTNWFEPENHWVDNVGMIVYDQVDCAYTTDGVNWIGINEDHL